MAQPEVALGLVVGLACLGWCAACLACGVLVGEHRSRARGDGVALGVLEGEQRQRARDEKMMSTKFGLAEQDDEDPDVYVAVPAGEPN